MRIRRKLTLGFIIIAVLVGTVGYISLNRIERIATTINVDIPAAITELEYASYLDELSHHIRYYDEVLTQSARNYAFTGNRAWEKRYRDTEPTLDIVIKEALRLGDAEEKKFFSSVDGANQALVEMEYNAISLVNNDRMTEAVKILESDEYRTQKELYKKGLDDYINTRGSAHTEAHLVSTKKLQEASLNSQDIVTDAKSLVTGTTILALVLAIGLGAYIGGTITRPIDRLTNLVRSVARGEIPARERQYADGEVGFLAETFFDMTENLKETTVSVERLMREVEERKAAVAAYKKSEQRLKAAQKISSVGDWELDLRNDRMYWSDEMYRILGAQSGTDALSMKEYLKYVHPDDREMVESAVEDALKGARISVDHRIVQKKDGTERIVHQQAEVTLDTSGVATGMAGTLQDITDRKRMECKLEALSTTDELTGLHNRRGFFSFGDRLMKLARRENRGVYLLYCDLDYLKSINDRFGHKEGDAALVLFAGILRRTYRETDVVARIGGDEFVVFPVGPDVERVEDITNRLDENIKAFNASSDRRYNISASAGVAYFDPADPVSMDELLARGDRSMYEAKSKKKQGFETRTGQNQQSGQSPETPSGSSSSTAGSE